ncbi:polyprenyl synthetase family protein [Nocardia sp. NPDC052566]|uniref:polyprenyl synthetase family protein n=1 Tax=Nocardia sp. NPDC052566 TaxID=3364330 RepID=UPI0037C5B4BD
MTAAESVGTASRSTEAWQILERARALTEPELRRAVDRLAEPVRSVAAYHFGWLDEAGRPDNGDWGKGMRSALVLASAQALGAPPELAVAPAAAVELVHNFSLVHDDLMDGDVLRRGRHTVWAVFGDTQAVLTGDALLVLAMDVIAERTPRLCRAALRELCDALLGLVAGQGADLAFELRAEVGLDECLRMAAGKTAALLAACCALGALAAGVDDQQVARLREFGHRIGIAFQLVDDLLGIWGDTSATGKPVGADLRRRKKSLPVAAAMAGGSAAGHRLAALYRRVEPLGDSEIREAAGLIEEAGGRRWAQEEARRQRSAALDCLTGTTMTAEGVCALTAIADLITGRNM